MASNLLSRYVSRSAAKSFQQSQARGGGNGGHDKAGGGQEEGRRRAGGTGHSSDSHSRLTLSGGRHGCAGPRHGLKCGEKVAVGGTNAGSKP